MPFNNPYFVKPAEELFAGRTGTPFNASGPRDYTRRFRVVVTELGKQLGPLGVTTCPGLPLAFSPYQTTLSDEYDLLALLTKATPKQEHDDDWQNWIIDCNYSTMMPGGGPPPGSPEQERANKPNSSMNNPEEEPPEIEWDFETVNKALPYDLDGKPFTNSAKQPFSPPPTFEQAYAVLVYSRNELNFNSGVATQYAYAVNSDVFLGRQPGTAQCLPPKAKQIYRGSLAYWKVGYRIRFGPIKFKKAENQIVNPVVVKKPNKILEKIQLDLEDWQPKILDAGTMQLAQGTGNPALEHQPVAIIRLGVVVTQPVLLDGLGRAAKPNKAGVIEPSYINFRVYPARPFTKLLQRGFTEDL